MSAPAWWISRAGTRISRCRRVAIMAWPPRRPWRNSCPSGPGVAVSWCSQPAMLAASSAPPIHTVLTCGYPDGKCRRAAPCLASRKMFSTWVRCRYQCSIAAALSAVDTSRKVEDERVAVDGVRGGELVERQCALVGMQGAAPPRPRVGGHLPGGHVEPDPADRQPGGRGPPVRAIVGHRDL